ncbi:MAG: hypothetical protein JXA67_09890 [Micromonosporaceae bacterium]|nr:hypothetical protein [Micromonosporaceae bacterium]
MHPPFAAPPAQRDAKRLWIGLGAGALVMVLCCVGGLVGLGFLYAGSVQEADFNARQLVIQYLEALQDRDYPAAYRLLCDDLTDDRSLQTFSRIERQDPVVGFSVAEDVGSDPENSADLLVDANVSYSRRGVVVRQYVVRNALEGMTVCGER